MWSYKGKSDNRRRLSKRSIIIIIILVVLVPTVKYWIWPLLKKVNQDKKADTDYFQASANRVKPTNPVRQPFVRR